LSSLGNKGEGLACRYLKRNGYQIVKNNYRCRIGEIDIIAKKDECLVFVEVKTRLNKEFGEPFESVTSYKQERLRRLAEIYVASQIKEQLPCRFDIVSILFEKGKPVIHHIENAF